MEYRGIEYQVVLLDVERGGTRAGWRWSVRIDPYTSASGTEGTRSEAIEAALQAIDRALASKVTKTGLDPPP
jgi:hypothetical protein